VSPPNYLSQALLTKTDNELRNNTCDQVRVLAVDQAIADPPDLTAVSLIRLLLCSVGFRSRSQVKEFSNHPQVAPEILEIMPHLVPRLDDPMTDPRVPFPLILLIVGMVVTAAFFGIRNSVNWSIF